MHFELSPADEVILFEFICPTTKTRGSTFSLFNRYVKWDAEYSALLLTDGRRRRFDLQYMIDFEFASTEVIREAMSKLPGRHRESYETWQSVFQRFLAENAAPRPEVRKAPGSVEKRL